MNDPKPVPPAHGPLSALERSDAFIARHIGTSADDQAAMLAVLGYPSRAALMDAIVPASIRRTAPLALPGPVSETEALAALKAIAAKNRVLKSFIGQGYYGTHTPAVIARNILENPAWYTAYTPYQPEISQGRLEALINFQTMVCDLTGMAIANASMLDEATAAAEAMTLCQRMSRSASRRFYVAADVFLQTIDVVRTRAAPLDIEVVVGPADAAAAAGAFAVLLQYPGADGDVRDYRELTAAIHASGGFVVVAADVLALTLLAPPGDWGADVAVGSTQRFGVPMGYGGPHAGYLATRDEFKRSMPGRLVGVTVDADGGPAYRLALQTREQHIRREKATSNICTAQVLLAVMASMYAVYHGADGLTTIARRVHRLACILKAGLVAARIHRADGGILRHDHRRHRRSDRRDSRMRRAPRRQLPRGRCAHAGPVARRDDDPRRRRARLARLRRRRCAVHRRRPRSRRGRRAARGARARRRRSSPIRRSAATARRRTCCATCAVSPTATSRSTAR